MTVGLKTFNVQNKASPLNCFKCGEDSQFLKKQPNF